MQAGIEECDIELLKRTVHEALENDAYFIGMGDYLDCASPSNRKSWTAMTKYDSFEKAMDEKMALEEDKLMEILEPTRGRWLGMLTGHHYWQFMDGTTTDTRLADRLETVHLGKSAMVRVYFEDDSRKAMCTIWCHHGQGSGDPMLKLRKMAGVFDADLYLMGHYHQLKPDMLPRLTVVGPKNAPRLLDRNRKLVATGSYLRGYMAGNRKGNVADGTYVEQAVMVPVSLGSPLVDITPIQEHGVSMVDIRVTI